MVGSKGKTLGNERVPISIFTQMLTLTQRLSNPPDDAAVSYTLSLTAEERTRSHYRFETPENTVFLLRLPRGTVLRDRDLLQPETGDTLVQIAAKPEPVLTVTAKSPLDLLRAAYHLGNRHVPMEIAAHYLRLSPDPVLRTMLEHLSVEVREDILPFQPETGVYGHSDAHRRGGVGEQGAGGKENR